MSRPFTGGVRRHGDPHVVGEQHPERLGVGRGRVPAQDLLVLRGQLRAAPVLRVRGRVPADRVPRALDQAVRGGHRDVEGVGDLRRRPAAHVAEHERRPLPGRQVHERGDQRELDQLVGGDVVVGKRPDLRAPLEDVAHRHRPPARRLAGVEEDVRRDAVEPRPGRRATLEAVLRPPGTQERLLHEVVGVRHVAGQPVAVRAQLAPVHLEIHAPLLHPTDDVPDLARQYTRPTVPAKEATHDRHPRDRRPRHLAARARRAARPREGPHPRRQRPGRRPPTPADGRGGRRRRAGRPGRPDRGARHVRGPRPAAHLQAHVAPRQGVRGPVPRLHGDGLELPGRHLPRGPRRDVRDLVRGAVRRVRAVPRVHGLHRALVLARRRRLPRHLGRLAQRVPARRRPRLPDLRDRRPRRARR